MKKIARKIQKKHVANEDVPILSAELRETFLRFTEDHPAKRVSLNLRKMIIEFLQYDGAIEAGYLNDLLFDLEGLFELLDTIESTVEIKSYRS